MSRDNAPICPVCNGVSLRTDTRYGPRYDCCGLWSWGRFPLVDGPTHEARKAAHGAFDPVWRGGLLSRSEAYRQLAKALGLSCRACHIKLMDESTARKVVTLADAMR